MAFFVDANGTTHGFIDTNGAFATVDAPKTAFNQLLGINDVGQEAGYSSLDPAGMVNQLAYVRQPDGSFTYLNLPTNVNSQATGHRQRRDLRRLLHAHGHHVRWVHPEQRAAHDPAGAGLDLHPGARREQRGPGRRLLQRCRRHGAWLRP